jgi:rubrerythrin
MMADLPFTTSKDDRKDDNYSFCFKCGYIWTPRSEGRPKRCPRCHSSRWDVPDMRERTCKFCGLHWRMEDIEDPCPKCGKKQTEGITDRSLHCNQCDHDWIRKGDSDPKKCPLCRSKEWNQTKANRLMCQQCGHVWRNKSGQPKRCPNCQSKIWARPLKAVRCQRCGHIWKMRITESSSTSTMCPKCKSFKWNESPMVHTCERCGKTYFIRSNIDKRCPECNTPMSAQLTVCRSCGHRWYSKNDSNILCPKCDSAVGSNEKSTSTSMKLWTDGRFELTYVSENGYGCLYLLDDNIPVSANYMYEVLNRFNIKIGDVVSSLNNGSMNDRWHDLAKEMYNGRNEYEKFIDYFMKRLSISKHDARVLAIHFTGMSPEAIGKKLGYSNEEMSKAFDRIMKAYADSDIIVDDTVFTENPFQYY